MSNGEVYIIARPGEPGIDASAALASGAQIICHGGGGSGGKVRGLFPGAQWGREPFDDERFLALVAEHAEERRKRENARGGA